MNDVKIIGRLTKDLVLNKTKGGVNYITFVLAQKESKDKTNFLPCVAFEKTAENIVQFVKRGDMVAVSGRVRVNQVAQPDKTSKMYIDINIDRFYLLPNERIKKIENAQKLENTDFDVQTENLEFSANDKSLYWGE